MAMSPLFIDLTKTPFLPFFEKKSEPLWQVKPENFKYYTMCLFNKQLLYKLEVFERGLEKTFYKKFSPSSTFLFCVHALFV